MKKIPRYRNLEDTLAIFRSKSQKGSINVHRVFKILGGKELDVAIICIAAPFCLPMHIPFLSIPFGALIMFIGVRMYLGKGVWLPRSLMDKELSVRGVGRVAKVGMGMIKVIKTVVHPRMEYCCYRRIFRKMNSILVVCLGLVLFIPCPMPIATLSASLALLGISLGLLNDDGLVVVVGYVFSILTCIGLIFAFTMGCQRI